MVLQAIKYTRGKLEILDQLRLPHEEAYVDIDGPEDARTAIRLMQVRGAPAIAIVAALSLAVWADMYIRARAGHRSLGPTTVAPQMFSHSLKYLVTSRPTAVNLADAARKLERVVWATWAKPGAVGLDVFEAYIKAAEQMLVDDVQDNENIGKHGAKWIRDHIGEERSIQRVSIVTHCNTGSLATAGYGTALGVVRSLHAQNQLQHCFYTETRPYNQGSRLTGYELIHDKIPATLITDSMVAALLHQKATSENIAAIVVGADRVAANGDTANKIGTYALAILARFHKVKFLIAAPRTTIDLGTVSGAHIKIEERLPTEMTRMKGPRFDKSVKGKESLDTWLTEEISIAAEHTQAWNPAFDVTPAELIDGIVTEKGVVVKDKNGRFEWDGIFDNDRTDQPLHVNIPPGHITWKEALEADPDKVPIWSEWSLLNSAEELASLPKQPPPQRISALDDLASQFETWVGLDGEAPKG